MSRHELYALAVLLATSVACGNGHDSTNGNAGEGDAARGGMAASSGASGRGNTNGGIDGAAAGHSAQGGAGAGHGGNATSGSAGATSAGRPSAGGTSGTGESGGASSGRAGSATLGGSGGHGGDVAGGGSAGLAGAGGDANATGSSCTDPLDTVDVSRLVASESFDPYAVTGDTANQIRQSINQNRTTDYDAYTGWNLTWKFGNCSGNGLVVTVDVTYQFPKWYPSATASAELTASWNTYTDALFCHEYGHAKHGLDCANDVYDALSAIDAGGDCNKQQNEADAAFSALLDHYNQLDIQYDADTNHGATMGAVFPPPQ